MTYCEPNAEAMLAFLMFSKNFFEIICGYVGKKLLKSQPK